jgi:hypothetical protein
MVIFYEVNEPLRHALVPVNSRLESFERSWRAP